MAGDACLSEFFQGFILSMMRENELIRKLSVVLLQIKLFKLFHFSFDFQKN
jgi:hypothetical protein